jgi:hypothetical protein
MTPSAFAAGILEWHDFFIAVAGASAGLLGLLFVGVSINLGAIAAEERVDLRARSSQAFTNLLFVLAIALLMLIPNPDPTPLAEALALVAAIGLVRVAANGLRTYRQRRHLQSARATMRRIGWTVFADLILAFTAWRLFDSGGNAAVIVNLAAVVFVLLIGAADISWELLTEVSAESRP